MLKFCQDQMLVKSKLAKAFVYNPLTLYQTSKLKAYADDKINVTEKLKFVLGSVENIVGKGKMMVTNNFSFSNNVFKRSLSQGR